MNYYSQKSNKSKAGCKYTKLVVVNKSPLLKKSPNGAYYQMVPTPDGRTFAVVIHKKGSLVPFRNMERLPKVLRRHKTKVA